MRKHYFIQILVLILFLLPLGMIAQRFEIPDKNFEQALIDLGYDTGIPDGSYYASTKVKNAKVLDLSLKRIEDLTGIEGFISLQELDCFRNNLSNLDLSKNKFLKKLNCKHNQIESLDVSNNTYITHLVISYNNLQELDVSKNTALKDIYCNNNHIKSIDVSKNSQLSILDCKKNKLSCLDLSSNPNLGMVDCSENPKLRTINVKNGFNEDIFSFSAENSNSLNFIVVDDITAEYLKRWKIDAGVKFLSSKDEIPVQIFVPDNNFEQALIDLGYDNKMDDYVFKNKIENVTKLDISKKQIDDLTGIEEFTSLIELRCDENNLQSLDLAKNVALERLYCSQNSITNIDLSKNTALKTLDLSNNNINEIDVSNNSALTILNLNNAKIESLDLNNNTALKELYCNENSLKYLYLYTQDELTKLHCSKNNLNYIGILDKTKLTNLKCSENNFSNLDLSNNKALETLECNNCKDLDYIDVRNGNNNNFQHFELQCNEIKTCVFVDNKEADYLKKWQVTDNIELLNGERECRCFMTYLPDDNFEQALIDLGYDSGKPDDYVFTNDIRNISDLDIQNKGIKNLTGLENFNQLKTLLCSGNELTKLELSGHSTIEVLDCGDNQLKDLDVWYLPNLISFKCNGNEIATLDFNNNKDLKNLNCSSNLLKDLELSENRKLTSLECQSNQLTSLNLSKNWDLEILRCQNNQIEQIEFRESTKFVTLECDQNHLPFSCLNKIKSIYPDFTYTTDKRLYQEQTKSRDFKVNYYQEYRIDNNITTFTWFNAKDDSQVDDTMVKDTGIGSYRFLLSGKYYCKMRNDAFPGLELKTANITILSPNIVFKDENFKKALFTNHPEIDANNNGEITEKEAADYKGPINAFYTNIKDLSDIKYFTGITSLNCNGNELKSIDLSKNTALEELYCSSNKLANLDLSYNKALKELGCSNNQLTRLDVSNCSELTNFSCFNNQLSSLELSNNVALTRLHCSSNKLSRLDVSNCKILKELECYENQLTSLYVGSCTTLTELSCYDNRLSSLNISNCKILKELKCYENQLTGLDAGSCTTLTELFCYDNRLSSLNVSNCKALEELECYENQLTSLDVSSCKALKKLHCFKNKITNLDVSNCKVLTNLDCDNNQLANLDLSDCEALANLRCSYNKMPFSSLFNIILNYPRLDYSSGKAIFEEQKINQGSELDFSTEAKINGEITEFVWYDRYGTKVDNTVVKDLGNGVFKFLKWGTYYCTMINEEFPNLKLSTVNFTIVADNIKFKDDQFKKALLTNYKININNDGEIDQKEASGFNGKLDVESCNIKDLSGIEYFTSIIGLNCRGNNLKSIDLSNNKSLEELDCANNQLTNLNVSSCTSITELDCSNNQLTNLNVSGCKSLNLLRCNENVISKLDLSSNTGLEYLFCNDNKLADLDISNTTALIGLYCENNLLKTLDTKDNTVLENLDCRNNQLSVLDVRKSTKLDYFYCNENNLTTLDVSQNITMSHFECSFNELKSLDVSQCQNLKILHCNSNQIETLVLRYEGALEELSCYRNKLVELDFKLNSKLQSIDCSSNQLTDLDVRAYKTLYKLYCTHNEISKLNLRNKSVLRILSCHNNILTDLDLTNTNGLFYLSCQNNLLKTLDTKEKKDLKFLDCDNNQLATLDVSQNKAIEYLSCYNNQLNKLDLSSNKALNELYCKDNKIPFSYLYEIKSNYPQLSYSSEKEIFQEKTKPLGYIINYSIEATFNGKETVFTWFNSVDDSEVDNTVVKDLGKGLFEFLQPGIYYCKMVNDEFQGTELKTAPVSIDVPTEVKTQKNSAVVVYPNPMVRELNINTGNEVYKSGIIYNVAGNLVKRFDINQRLLNIDVSDLGKGMYLLQLKGENGALKTIKLVKK